MLIKVRYTNKKYDMVKHSRLDNLIRAGEIEVFYRASGWVDVKKDRLRGYSDVFYLGPERRRDAIPGGETLPVASVASLS